MESAAVEYAHGEEQKQRRDGKVIEKSDKIENTVGEILEAIEKRERFDHVAQPVFVGEQVAKVGHKNKGKQNGNGRDRRRKLALGDGGNKGADGDKRHADEKHRQKITEQERELYFSLGNWSIALRQFSSRLLSREIATSTSSVCRRGFFPCRYSTFVF